MTDDDKQELVAWLVRQTYTPDEGDDDERAYRRTWNSAINHVVAHLIGSKVVTPR